MNTSKEKKLILLCTNIEPTDAVRKEISTLITTNLDWHKIVSEAKNQGVASLVYHNLSGLPDKQAIPPDILFNLKKYYLDTIGRNVVVFDELKIVLTLLQQAGIKAVVLKGPALIATVYKDWGLRWIGDIDLLVPENDLFKAQDYLISRGYVQDKQMTRQKYAHHHLIGIRSKKNSIRIELHWTLNVNPLFKLDVNMIWNRVKKCTINDCSTLILSPEDTLLHVCLHHCYNNIHNLYYKSVYDITAVIQHYGNSINWALFINNCIQYKTITLTYIGLNLAKQLFSVNIPSHVLKSLQCKNDKSQMMCFEMLKELKGKSVSNLFLLNDLSKRMHYIRQKFFPSIEFLAFRYSVPIDSKFVYLLYFVRPFQLVKDHLPIAFKLLFTFIIHKIQYRVGSNQPAPLSFLKNSNTE
ncbi:MAG: nucleotidyltransferase family protein [bacterium]